MPKMRTAIETSKGPDNTKASALVEDLPEHAFLAALLGWMTQPPRAVAEPPEISPDAPYSERLDHFLSKYDKVDPEEEVAEASRFLVEAQQLGLGPVKEMPDG